MAVACAALLALVEALVLAAQTRQPTKINPKDGLTYVWINPGRYNVGCSPGDNECLDHEKPARRVTVSKRFWIGRTEVTQAAYLHVIGKNPSRYPGARRPVDQLSWNDAHQYCLAVGMRLPTEIEWEYAARAGNPLSRYGPLGSIGWYDGNSDDSTHEVGRKKPNAYGLYDMLGNVWEWVDDWSTEAGKKILRGGSFYDLSADVRVSSLQWAAPDVAHLDMGVRCAGD